MGLAIFLIGMAGLFGSIVAAIIIDGNHYHHNSRGLAMAIGGIVTSLIVMVLGIVRDNMDQNRTSRHNHRQAFTQLRNDGWNIQSNDIHITSNKIDVNCLKFTLKKYNGRYQVVVKRNKNVGGGYTLLQPNDQKVFRAVCSHGPQPDIFKIAEGIRP